MHTKPYHDGAALQICLAAEKCGSLGFDVHNDMWYSSEGFLCDVTQTGQVTYWNLLKKVPTTWLLPPSSAAPLAALAQS